MRSTLILAVLAGVCVAVQTSLTGAAQRTLGPAALVAISGLTTGGCALLVAIFVAKPEFTGRAVGYAVASGVLGAVIVGSIAVAAGQGGVARVLSLVIRRAKRRAGAGEFRRTSPERSSVPEPGCVALVYAGPVIGGRAP